MFTFSKVLKLFSLLMTTSHVVAAAGRCSICNKGEKSDGSFDCSSCGLGKIPNFPPTATTIDISYNNITALENRTFLSTPKLQELNLANNEISRIHNDAFWGLHDLKKLDISGNLYTAFPDTLANLRFLKVLAIDLFSGFHFDDRFLKLDHLSEVSFNCWRENFYIHNDSFIGLRNAPIKTIDLTCGHKLLKPIGMNFLEPLTSLKNLHFGLFGAYDTKNIFRMLYGLRNRELNVLNLNKNIWYTERSLHLTVDDIKYLSTICVKELYIANNGIFHFPFESALNTNFSRCLETIDMADNQIIWSVSSLFALASFPSIRFVNASDSSNHANAKLKKRKIIKPDLVHNITITIYCPVSLESFDLSGLQLAQDSASVYFVSLFHMKCPGLRSFKASNTGCNVCRLPVKFETSLTFFDMSGWNCKDLNSAFLSDFKQLRILIAANSFFGLDLNNNKYRDLLLNVQKLDMLDFSSNSLASLHVDFFQGQTYSLRTLHLNGNKFTRIPPALKALVSIKFVDMKDNNIAFLNDEDRTIIDNLDNTVFDFSGNRFECSCRFVSSIVWMSERKHFFNHSYCTDGNNISLILENIESFQIKCLSEFWLDFSVVSLLLMIVVILLLAAGYRNKALVIYFYLKMRRFVKHQKVDQVQRYRYDIFVSYSEMDLTWVTETLCPYLTMTAGLDVCIHHKDFIPGRPIAEEILRCIDESRKSAFVITKNFLNSEWSLFEMEIARQHVFHHESDTLIIILKDEIPIHKMPNVLRKIWWRVVCLKYPQNDNEMEHEMFWRKLQEAVR